MVRVRNLQTTIEGPSDAWNRKGRQQPLSVSASVMLKEAFDTSSTADKVAGDTVHYGLLSKAILASLEGQGQQHPAATNKPGDTASTSRYSTLRDVVNTIWEDLTYQDDNGRSKATDEEEHEAKSFLKASTIRCFELTAHLPKASLLGGGVSLTRIAIFGRDGESRPQPRGMSLKIHDLRVPTLIGVNDNERKAKQVVVACIEIDKFNIDEDVFTMIEAETVEVSKILHGRPTGHNEQP
jgi:dihydroneopterin aldolase